MPHDGIAGNTSKIFHAICRARYSHKLSLVKECLADLDKIDLLAQSEEGKTPLEYAKQWGFSDIEAEITQALNIKASRPNNIKKSDMVYHNEI